MKYLKKFNESKEIRQDITEICYDITDYGKFMIGFQYNSRYDYIYIVQPIADIVAYDGLFKFDDIKEVCLRIKEYLGDNYLSFQYRKNNNEDKDAILNENTEILEKIKLAWINCLSGSLTPKKI